MYNMIFGVNPDSGQLLEVLGKKRSDFGRFRDVYFDEGYIVVHTRNGGGNREDFQSVFDEMKKHPMYERNEDCEDDNTYADFYFKVPEEIVSDSGIDEYKSPREHLAEYCEKLISGLK